MRIGVVGDIHGNYDGLCRAVERMNQPDLLLFTGDGYRDISRYQGEYGVRVEGVIGNCDFFSMYSEELLLELGGLRVLLTHGHIYSVKNGLTRIGLAGQSKEVDLVVFGHTHQPLSSEWNGILLFNPGALTTDRTLTGPRFGIIEIADKKASLRLEKL